MRSYRIFLKRWRNPRDFRRIWENIKQHSFLGKKEGISGQMSGMETRSLFVALSKRVKDPRLNQCGNLEDDFVETTDFNVVVTKLGW